MQTVLRGHKRPLVVNQQIERTTELRQIIIFPNRDCPLLVKRQFAFSPETDISGKTHAKNEFRENKTKS